MFIKTLPDGSIKLHDEMRRMINLHVWPEVDPDNDRRKHESKSFIEYIEPIINDLNEKILHMFL